MIISSLIASIGTKILIGAVIVSLAGGAWFYVQSIRADNARLLQNQTILEDVIDAKDAEIEERRNAFIKQTQELKNIDQKNIKSAQRIADLLQVLGDGRIGRIAKKKPNIIQNKINKANRLWNEEMRLLTDPKSYE